MSKLTYKHTLTACFNGYIVQAIINNFIPLLFLTFNRTFDISLTKITFLVSFNFGFQLLVDAISVKFVDKIGYRLSTVIAHIFSALGLILLAFLPYIFNDAFTGIIISVAVYAIGGGMIEVLISPIAEFSPTENKEKTMSLLHSFYCWGHVLVVLISSIFFWMFGIENWRVLSILWAIIPIANVLLFLKVPINEPDKQAAQKGEFKRLFLNKTFWIMIVLMLCAGASEQAVSQWASTFAEKTLGIRKEVGDLAAPMMFAIFMGSSRSFYGKYGHRININSFMLYTGGLCVISYLLIALSNNPILGLIGCALSGLSVGIMWPGTFSISSKILKGGTSMFGLLAMAGDIGCMAGPALVGIISKEYDGNLKAGILSAAIFPLVLITLLFLISKNSKASTQKGGNYGL